MPNKKVPPFIWILDCQSSFYALCLCLANTPTVHLPDPHKSYLLFMDASKYCYLGVLTQASMNESNEALVQLLKNTDPLTSVEPQTQDFKLDANLVHPICFRQLH